MTDRAPLTHVNMSHLYSVPYRCTTSAMTHGLRTLRGKCASHELCCTAASLLRCSFSSLALLVLRLCPSRARLGCTVVWVPYIIPCTHCLAVVSSTAGTCQYDGPRPTLQSSYLVVLRVRVSLSHRLTFSFAVSPCACALPRAPAYSSFLVYWYSRAQP